VPFNGSPAEAGKRTTADNDWYQTRTREGSCTAKSKRQRVVGNVQLPAKGKTKNALMWLTRAHSEKE